MYFSRFTKTGHATIHRNTSHFLDIVQPRQSGVPLSVIEECVVDFYGLGSEDLRVARKRVGEAKGMFIELACWMGRRSQRQVAAYLGTVSEHAVGKARHRLNVQTTKDASVDSRKRELIALLKSKV